MLSLIYECNLKDLRLEKHLSVSRQTVSYSRIIRWYNGTHIDCKWREAMWRVMQQIRGCFQGSWSKRKDYCNWWREYMSEIDAVEDVELFGGLNKMRTDRIFWLLSYLKRNSNLPNSLFLNSFFKIFVFQIVALSFFYVSHLRFERGWIAEKKRYSTCANR